MEKYQIMSIGRSSVDIIIELSNNLYNNIATFFNISAGQWAKIRDEQMLNSLLKILDVLSFEELLQKSNIRCKLEAGTTNLNFISALPVILQKKSIIITAKGTRTDGSISILNETFVKSVISKGISYKGIPYVGKNPYTFVFVSEDNPEKIMATYMGISSCLSTIGSVWADYLYVDAYEMQEGAISELINQIVLRKEIKVILGLGNEVILTGELLNKIRYYCQNGLIHILCGNQNEYRKLTNESDACSAITNSLLTKIPYKLMTLGKNGILGSFGNQHIFESAISVEHITNTSGAGDYAAGAFSAGIIRGDSIKNILKNTVRVASLYLNSKSRNYSISTT